MPNASKLTVAYATYERAGCYACHKTRGFDTDIAPGALETVLHDGPTVVSLYPGFVLGIEI